MDIQYRVISMSDAQQIANRSSSYSRLEKILELDCYLSESKWLRLLGKNWSCCDNISMHIDDLFESPFGMKCHQTIPQMMTLKERKALDQLPEVVTIYRGCYDINKQGFSWSLNRETAKRFPMLTRYYRADEQPYLITARVKREHIIALKLDRGEEEAIASWGRVQRVSTRKITY
jgi:hypothetical protein